jgi:hypothetical protein
MPEPGMFVQMIEYRQPVSFLVGEVAHLPAGRLHAADDPAQSAGPVLRPGHQAGDLGGVLVLLGGAVLGGAVLGGAGLPRAGREQPDGVLVGRHDRPAAGEQHGFARGGTAQQVADEVVAGAGAVDADPAIPAAWAAHRADEQRKKEQSPESGCGGADSVPACPEAA